MRRIALFISLISLSLGCSDGEEMGGAYSSIASLWHYVGQGTVLITDDIYICGSVVANDAYGELSSAIVVADASGGVMIELDMEGISDHYPLYSVVQVSCSGLWLGSVGPKLILGAEPTEKYVVDRMPAQMALNRVVPLAKNNDTPTIRHRTIAELEYRDVLSCVELEGLSLVESEHGLLWIDRDTLTNRPIPTLRHFAQGADTLRVVTNAECHYATEAISLSPLTVVGVLDWLDNDIALRVSGHQIRASY